MFEGDYCPNCDNYIKELEAENELLEHNYKVLVHGIAIAMRERMMLDDENQDAETDAEAVEQFLNAAREYDCIAALQPPKESRTKVPDCVTTVRNAVTGETLQPKESSSDAV